MTMQFQRLMPRRPVGEQHGHGGDHLHVDAEAGVIVDARLRVECRIPHFAEELAVLVDAVAAVGMRHHREAVVAVLGRQVRPVAGQDVRVGVDLEHPCTKTFRHGVACATGRAVPPGTAAVLTSLFCWLRVTTWRACRRCPPDDR
ncbi:hypothetical protein [Rhodanobacter lindaniclasticus]